MSQLNKPIRNNVVLYVISFIWGVAEGTFFFIVPDVFITYIAIKDWKKGVMSCLFVLIGSLLGASLLFINAEHLQMDQLQAIPLINQSAIDTAMSHIEQYGEVGVVHGPINGIPHKIYSLYAGKSALTFSLYLFYSAISRVTRFILLSLVASGIASILKSHFNLSNKWMLRIHLSSWMLFYIFYAVTITS